MRIKVFIEKGSREMSVEIPSGKTIEHVLKKLKINPQTVIVVKNSQVVPEHVSLKEKDSLKILSVKLGG
jgi:sulfur carrier protein ThiS